MAILRPQQAVAVKKNHVCARKANVARMVSVRARVIVVLRASARALRANPEKIVPVRQNEPSSQMTSSLKN
jgi:hypothetical protein